MSGPTPPILPGPSTPFGGKKSVKSDPNTDKAVAQRISYLWSASQVAFASNHASLANMYLNNLITYSEKQGFAVSTDVSLCTKCNSLLIPGATAKVKLIPCQSLSNEKHSEMQEARKKMTTIAYSSHQQPQKVKNALLYSCKRCSHIMITEGTQLTDKEKKKSSISGPSTAKITPKGIETHTKEHVKPTTTKGPQPKQTITNKTVSKEVAAKEERQRLLASMLKSSTQQPQPKKVDPFASSSPKKSASPAPAKTPKKSLFNFLNSL